MKRFRSLVVLSALTLVAPRPVSAEEPKGPPPIEEEHIFGFTEGTDVGQKGDLELENTTVGGFSRPGGGFAAVSNELAARYGLTDAFRASVGVLTDYHDIHGFSDIADVSRLDFSGLSSEFRFAAIPRGEAAVAGVTLSFAPYWRRVDSASGASSQNGALPLTLLLDRELIPGKLFAAANATYAPSFEQVPGGWRTDHDIEFSAAASYQIFDGVFLGGEVRRDLKYQAALYPVHGLFAGPSLFIKLSESMSVKVAWAPQIADFGSGRMNLTEYERHEALLLLVKTF